jgi:hypothetical protein
MDLKPLNSSIAICRAAECRGRCGGRFVEDWPKPVESKETEAFLLGIVFCSLVFGFALLLCEAFG